MAATDFIILIVWLLVVSVIGIVAGMRETVDGFWTNNRQTTTSALVFTIVATQVGAGTIVGITSSTFSSGTGFGLVAVVSTVSGFLAIGYIAPWLKRFGDFHKAVTLPEILKVRYGRRTQVLASLVITFAYASLLAGQFIASTTLLSTWTGWDLRIALILAAVGLVGYTAFAGLKGDILTDTIHFFTMVTIFFFVLTPSIFAAISFQDTISRIPMTIWSPVTFGGYSYLVAGILFGAVIPIVSMELWMRIYASTDAAKARKAFLWSSLAVIPFYLLAIVLGIVSITLYQPNTDGDLVFYKLMADFLPSGFVGWGIAATLAVILSTANTLILVISATVFRDIFGPRLRQDDILLSRIITALAGVAGAGLAWLIPDIVQLMLNAFFLIAVLCPALFGVAMWTRATERGATWSIGLGAITTLACLLFIPHQAFLPGVGLAIIAFILISRYSNHSQDEQIDTVKLFGPELS